LRQKKRARDGSGYAVQGRPMVFRPAEATEGSPTHGRARASVGAARAKPRHCPSRIGADSPTAPDFGPAGAKALRRLKQRTMPRRGAVGAGRPERDECRYINKNLLPAGRRGRSPAGGAPKPGAGAPKKQKNPFARKILN